MYTLYTSIGKSWRAGRAAGGVSESAEGRGERVVPGKGCEEAFGGYWWWSGSDGGATYGVHSL